MAGGLSSLTVVFFYLLEFLVHGISTTATHVVVERDEFTLSLRVPLTDDVLKHMLIVIGIDHRDARRAISDVMYIYPQHNFTFICQSSFQQRINVSKFEESSGQAVVLEIHFGHAEAETAGVFQCFDSTSMNNVIPNCETLLIVLRKARRPTILADTPKLGKPLKLICQAESATLPPDHGLTPLIVWRTNKNDSWTLFDEDQRVYIDQVSLSHLGMSFSCSFTDKANITSPVSDESLSYVIKIDGLPPTTPRTLAVQEHDNVTISLRIPKTDDIFGTWEIIVALDRHNGSDLAEVVYIYPRHRFAITLNDMFASRIEAHKVHEASGDAMRLVLSIAKADADLAGTYQCYKGVRSNLTDTIEDCNILLVVLRKADKPIIVVLKPARMGATLDILCYASSSSLPPYHGLAPLFIWNSSVHDSRIVTNSRGRLLFPNVTHEDMGRSVTCAFTDDANVTSPVSDESDPYVIEFGDDDIELDDNLTMSTRPVTETLAPEPTGAPDSVVYVLLRVMEGAILRKALGEVISLKCNAECIPTCSLSWSMKRKGQGSFFPIVNAGNSNEVTQRIRKNNVGTYCCTASNLYATSSLTFKLELAPSSRRGIEGGPGAPKGWPDEDPDRPPDVPMRTAYVTSRLLDGSVLRQREGEMISVKCIAVCVPSCATSWSVKKEGRKIFETVTGRVRRNQFLLRIIEDEAGVYSCSGTNIHATVHSSFTLQVVSDNASRSNCHTIFTLLVKSLPYRCMRGVQTLARGLHVAQCVSLYNPVRTIAQITLQNKIKKQSAYS